GTSRTSLPILLGGGTFFAADASFSLVLNSDGAMCTVRPATYDSYPGDGYVFNASWQKLHDVDGRYDIPFETLVSPVSGLSFTDSTWSGNIATRLNDGRVLLGGGGY